MDATHACLRACADRQTISTQNTRARGHPEWLQLLGLLHGLGRLPFVWFLEASRDFQSEYEDWSFGGQSWVVGCPIPDSIRWVWGVGGCGNVVYGLWGFDGVRICGGGGVVGDVVFVGVGVSGI